jgi:hypothetical protein
VLSLVLIVLGSLLLVGRSQVESAAGTGVVELAFTGTLTAPNAEPIAKLYQRVVLNVISVRLNPSPDVTISDSDPFWVEIPAPAEIGSTNPTEFITTSSNFGPTGTVLTAATSVLQLDLLPLQNVPFFFNSATLPAEGYHQIELELNFDNPGSAVPLCPQSAPAGEGCVSYITTLTPQGVLRVPFSNAFNVTPGSVQPLVVNIAVAVGPNPSADPDTTTVAISPLIIPQGNLRLSSTLPYNPALGVVTGAVTNFDVNNTTVTAEFAGTNQIVATTKLQPIGTFRLDLPAAALPNATLYDFYASGNGGYAVKSRVPVSSQGTAPTPPPLVNLLFAVPSSTFGSIAGTLVDACKGTPVEAATLNLLLPDTTVPGGASTCDLTGDPPAIPSNCVVVATAATDDQGRYPLMGTPFTNIPLSTPPEVPHYDLEINAPGFNTTLQQVAPGSLACPGSRFGNSCSFELEHGYLTGATDLSSPNDTGKPLNAMVIAEVAGTDEIKNFVLSTIPGRSTTGPFTIEVPDAAPSSAAIPVTNFDLFASVQDLFQGSPQKTSGHLIGTAASVGAPPADCSTIGVPALSPMDCVGLGSLDGSVSQADPSTTSVRLSKDGVQIMETEPNSIGLQPNGNNYNFCAPSDSYLLTHYESGIARSSVPITLAKPLIVPAPCSSICQDGNPTGTCLLCQPVAAPTLP